MNLNFAENFKRLRKEKGITQEKIAEVLGISAQSVSRWELSICYPDLEMLPSIANYFGVTVDLLLSNDVHSKERDEEIFKETLDRLSDKTTECIDFVREYCRKYPESDYYAYQLAYAIKRYAVGDDAKAGKYMPLLLKTVQRLLETQYRNQAIQFMVTLCDGKELDKWLEMTPYAGFGRRSCLVMRADARKEWEEGYVQKGLEMLECFAKQLDRRYPDAFGARKKAEFQREILKTIASFGKDGQIPDGWKMFYAYKQLVLAACLFEQGETGDGWQEFDSAMETCKYIFSLQDAWLEIGGALFSCLKVNKIWNYAMDAEGNKHKLFGIVNLSNYDMRGIYDLLTNPRWAWFDSVRREPRYQAVLAWVKETIEKQDEKT